MDASGFKGVETRHESALEGNGSRENHSAKLTAEDFVDPHPATGKEKEGALVSLKPNNVRKGQGREDQIGDNNRCSEDECTELASGGDMPHLEGPVENKGLVLPENDSRGKLRNHSASTETDRMVFLKPTDRRGSDGRKRSHGVSSTTLQGNGERFPSCSGVGRPHVDAEAAVEVLEEAYNKLYKKYQRSKTKNLAEFEAIYDEQTRKFAAFSTAADALVEKLRAENDFLRRQLQEIGVQEIINRSRQLEDEFIECRNDLVLERSKVLELEQELREAHLCILKLRTSFSNTGPAQRSWDPQVSQVAQPTVEIATRPESVDTGNKKSPKLPSTVLEATDEIRKTTVPGVESECANKEPSAEGALRCGEEMEVEGGARQSDRETIATQRGGYKILRELLQNVTQMSTVVDENSCRINFTHDESGFSFKLEQNKLSQEVGGDDALLYQAIAPGTILHLGPGWMQSEIIFDMVQAHVFFQRILGVALGCHAK